MIYSFDVWGHVSRLYSPRNGSKGSYLGMVSHHKKKKKKKNLIKCLRVIVQTELAPYEKSKIEGDVIGLKPMKQIYNLVIRKGLMYTYKLASMIFHNKVIDEIPTSIEILCNDTPSPKLVSFHQAGVLDCIWLTIPPIFSILMTN